MIEVEKEDDAQYYIKPEMEDAWADEIVKRTKQFLDGNQWTNLGVQNEPIIHTSASNLHVGPYRLRDFIGKKLQ